MQKLKLLYKTFRRKHTLKSLYPRVNRRFLRTTQGREGENTDKMDIFKN